MHHRLVLASNCQTEWNILFITHRGMSIKTVLLADDNQDMIELVQLVLQDSGYNMITANDGIVAVNICLEQSPDLVLMDLNMPNMNGFDATKNLRDKGFSNPIVVLTSSESEDDKKGQRGSDVTDIF